MCVLVYMCVFVCEHMAVFVAVREPGDRCVPPVLAWRNKCSQPANQIDPLLPVFSSQRQQSSHLQTGLFLAALHKAQQPSNMMPSLRVLRGSCVVQLLRMPFACVCAWVSWWSSKSALSVTKRIVKVPFSEDVIECCTAFSLLGLDELLCSFLAFTCNTERKLLIIRKYSDS